MSVMTYCDDDSINWYPNSGLYSFREQGPCTINDNGDVYFSQFDRRSNNRKQGPSKIFYEGTIVYQNNRGQYHRTNGPALIYAHGVTEYWVYDQRLTADVFFLKYGVL